MIEQLRSGTNIYTIQGKEIDITDFVEANLSILDKITDPVLKEKMFNGAKIRIENMRSDLKKAENELTIT